MSTPPSEAYWMSRSTLTRSLPAINKQRWNSTTRRLRALRPGVAFGTGTFGGRAEFFKAWGRPTSPRPRGSSTSASTPASRCSTRADIYSDGAAEEILGEAIKGRRDQVLISTKATFRVGAGPNDVGSSRHHLIHAGEAALKRLGTDYIDLFQLHGFDAMTPVEETLPRSTTSSAPARSATSAARTSPAGT